MLKNKKECALPGCHKTFRTNIKANAARKFCSRQCAVNSVKIQKAARLKLKARYHKLGEREKRAIHHLKVTLRVTSPTDTQIQDVCDYYAANWIVVKNNLDLVTLSGDSRFFNYQQ